ncbi:MAG: hypothetical protein OEU84_06315 [Xanthomonadales bacterium]|nr:hypothetical protein [Xanthomonadales bacterium]
MKHYLRPVFTLAVLLLLTATWVQAASEEKMVIALKTDNFELAETDISELAIGEAQTIETESGTIIDILRTANGADIYVDGELLDMDFDEDGLHEEHMIQKHVEIVCDDEEECDKHVIVLGDGDNSDWVTADGENVFIHKEVEISCTDDEDGTTCSEHMVLMSDDEDFDLEELHEAHQSGEGHKVIVIKKDTVSKN